MRCFVYLLHGEKISRYYIGKTVNLDARLNDHNQGTEIYTKRGVPWKLQGYIECDCNSEASTIERKMKKAKNKDYVIWYFKNNGKFFA